MKKQVIKAWAITCDFCEDNGLLVCCHDDEMNIYRTRKEVKEKFLAKDGLPNCTGDKIVRCEIHIPAPKNKKELKEILTH